MFEKLDVELIGFVEQLDFLFVRKNILSTNTFRSTKKLNQSQKIN